ncbi:hypothetical protein CP556_18220 [Natrinema sp. CBA1119]|uniref:hypothetical protein n=1 Tax=Natrinema sp. CBA1119 TaxID=1608465 RepID=UPI000BF751C7|nr:hypothetical protein [Natrinema sp. CBA1119]PGF18422.1 hypothetical protein CP556_18220 [Natrinema sp. CBA1119]
MPNLSTRRGFLALTATGTAASLAGCSQLESLAQNDSEDGGNAVTVAVQPDREALTSLQEEVQNNASDENLSQQEAQQVYRERQRELVAETATAFEESASERDFTIEASETEYGLFRVTGSDGAIMDALRNGDVTGIYPGEQYELLVQQQQRREQQRAMLEEQQRAQEGNETNGSDSGNVTSGSGSGNETAE